ncbi:phosphoribosyltransferase [Nocardiopsis dassonvillei]|uniref:phosphoribosyltransferase n=1 Tax=Nocardiopsis dassonvillei TaxID=2014 RepID=UPI0020A3DCF6|nr:phosphoribosyltransferase [Nocardiopsis dassonvillei]MCP3013839.1 phosphoribosyltransferase [Nocardiopsis dassonvillei]
MALRALIIDYKVLFNGDQVKTRAMLQWAVCQGLKWCLFTTEPKDPEQVCGVGNYPLPDAHVHLGDIPGGKKRGSPAWVDVAANRLGVERHELLYLGASGMDWRSAGHAGVFYLHAAWCRPLPSGHNAFKADSAAVVQLILDQFFLSEPHWAFKGSGDNWELRCLLPANASLPCTEPGNNFTLQDVLTYEKTVKIGSTDARSVLMFSVLANAYLEGLMTSGALMCVYPSSTPGKVSEQLSAYLQPASHLFRNYYRDDLLIRALKAPDTSLERVRARREGRTAQVSIATQANTVHIGADYNGRKKLAGKTVIVADDFTTRGMSLDWARTLFTRAGAQRVILLTVGKYGGASHTIYTPRVSVTPYESNSLKAEEFTENTVPLEHSSSAEPQMRSRINELISYSNS